jgi:DNA-binding NarL/FixJ family response regulator
MRDDVRVLVLEQGLGVTHDLSFACRHTGVHVLGPVQNVKEAEAAAREVPVDVLVVHLGDPSGEMLGEAVEALGGVQVVAMTSDIDPEVGAAVIAAGGCGLMERSRDERSVPRLLRRAAAGELVLPATHLQALVEMVRLARSDPGAERVHMLTRREKEVLALLADGQTTQDVALALSISVMTVQSHVKNVLAKLGVHSKVEAIRYAWRSGVLDMPVGA